MIQNDTDQSSWGFLVGRNEGTKAPWATNLQVNKETITALKSVLKIETAFIRQWIDCKSTKLRSSHSIRGTVNHEWLAIECCHSRQLLDLEPIVGHFAWLTAIEKTDFLEIKHSSPV